VHNKIRVLEAVPVDLSEVGADLERLFHQARQWDIPGMLTTLREIVPEFTPRYTFNGEAPLAFQRMRPDLFPEAKRGNGKVISIKK